MTHVTSNSISGYSASGNFYWVFPENAILTSDFIANFCLQKGGDGILVGYTHPHGYGVHIFNCDGSEAEMSGNGTRIFAVHLLKTRRIRHGSSIPIFTAQGGMVTCNIVKVVNPKIFSVEASLRNAIYDLNPHQITVLGKHIIGYSVSVFNPHFVIPLQDLSPTIMRLASHIACHENFPMGCNVEFFKFRKKMVIEAYFWERGVGETPSCGSGAIAVATIAHRVFFHHSPLYVVMKGGILHAKIDNTHTTIRGIVRFECQETTPCLSI
jgi:diaminopimelate epimerase